MPLRLVFVSEWRKRERAGAGRGELDSHDEREIRERFR
jgi:hypothetical protein